MDSPIKFHDHLELEGLVELAVPKAHFLVLTENGGVYTNLPQKLVIEMLAPLTNKINLKN
jgi:hypothetical protein